MAHQRLRPFRTGVFHHDPDAGRVMCMAVRAGQHVSVRGQTGLVIDGGFIGAGDPAAQADQAMRNIVALLTEAGMRLADVRKLTTYVTDRAWLAPVQSVIETYLGGAALAQTIVIVCGLATPEMLVAIDADAIVA